ncbi:hypothetical protein scyTo_0016541 [Scyliorhinus torazame]|uniref:Uncharacterized protein n=1 Tax=Scyliorhinus torazame TaxID=75743 RepID=A0A401PT10_SCYTO|nr:hypothetical protein [Scyliorhinus torazame]
MYDNCTLVVEVNNQTVFNSAQYLISYNNVTSYRNYTKRGIEQHDVVQTNLSESMPIGHHELTPYSEVSIMQADELESPDDDK